MNPAYVVILSQGVGGAEKRFAENYLELRRRGHPVFLVVSELTATQLAAQPGFQDIAGDHVLTFRPESKRYSDLVRAVRPILQATPKGATLHFPLAYTPFAARARGQRLIVSWVNVALPRSLAPRRLKATLVPWLSFLEADRIDILNPGNLALIKRVPRLGGKASLTAGGTFVNFDVYRPAAKKPLVVFLGRLEAEKNALALVRLLPEIVAGLKEAGIAPPAFRIAGAGAEAEAIEALLRTAAYADIEVESGYVDDPRALLAKSRVFLSLQRTSNYPSKALAEAMACGAFPVITEIGESRLMADEAIAAFVPRDLSAGSLVEALKKPLALDDEGFAALSARVVEAARARFRLEVQADYFARLYGFEPNSSN